MPQILESNGHFKSKWSTIFTTTWQSIQVVVKVLL